MILNIKTECKDWLQKTPQLNAKIVEDPLKILSVNPYGRFFQSLRQIPALEDCKIVIWLNVELERRVYNAPSSSQVASIWIESHTTERDIIV